MTSTKKVTKKPTVGQKLKTARLEQKLTLEEISRQLCITKTNLTLIEDNADNLNRDVYLIGFIRSYADFLHLDANELVKEFKEGGTKLPERNKDLTFPAPVPQESIPKTKILLSSAALAVILGFAVHHFTSKDISTSPLVTETSPTVEEYSSSEKENEVILRPVAMDEESELLIQPTSVVEGTQNPQPNTQTVVSSSATPEGNKNIVMKVSKDSWVEVRDMMGSVIVSKVFKSGESKEFNEKDNLILHTGNAGGITLTIDDYTTPPLGEDGQIMNHVALQTEKILAQNPKNQ